ncbi:related to alcohol dehydrogenase, class V [Fusarium oxysporum]|uniref:Related to alcohol dehydrogenase, class V n=1 Tax=Fusarium oxysporum TaxID=5507 RepID=A0A2H3TRW2_FUSOX|nr:related to alcohol dehydrogenase, class V [Fusarium oxysporum]
MAPTLPAMVTQADIPERHIAMVYDKPGAVSLRQQVVPTPRPAHGVGIKWVSSACLICPPCLDGADGCCLNLKISGYYTPGTFQQYTLAPAYYVTPIPEAVPSPVAAPLLCGGLTALAAMKKTNAPRSSWLLVAGAGGGVGHLVCQIAAKAYGHRVVGVDSASKEALVRECGADEFISLEEIQGGPPDQNTLVDMVRKLSGGLGVAAAVVCTGHLAAYDASLECLRFNGTLVVVGVQEGEEAPIQTASPNTFLFHQRRIVGSSVGNRQDALEVMALAAQGIIKPCFIQRSLDELPEIFQKMEDGKLLGKVVVQVPDTLA